MKKKTATNIQSLISEIFYETPVSDDQLKRHGFQIHPEFGAIYELPIGKYLNYVGNEVRILMKHGNGVMTIANNVTTIEHLLLIKGALS